MRNSWVQRVSLSSPSPPPPSPSPPSLSFAPFYRCVNRKIFLGIFAEAARLFTRCCVPHPHLFPCTYTPGLVSPLVCFDAALRAPPAGRLRRKRPSRRTIVARTLCAAITNPPASTFTPISLCIFCE